MWSCILESVTGNAVLILRRTPIRLLPVLNFGEVFALQFANVHVYVPILYSAVGFLAVAGLNVFFFFSLLQLSLSQIEAVNVHLVVHP